MVLEKVVYSPFNHLMRLIERESFISDSEASRKMKNKESY
jgi:hypothetical protein